MVSSRVKQKRVKSGIVQSQRYDVKPGGNVVIPVAIGLLNRIATPFSDARVRTANDGEIFTERGDVQVAVDNYATINVFVSENGVPDSTVSLTFVPRAKIPPTTASLKIPVSGKLAKDLRHAKQKAMWALDDGNGSGVDDKGVTSEHSKRLKKIMKSVAQGEIPNGFALEDEKSAVHPCSMPLEQVQGQQLQGSRLTIDVYRITNRSRQIQEVREEACYRPRVLAVATYPETVLQPGQSTELYIVKAKNSRGLVENGRKRPSLVEGVF